ncbi:MAG: MFS transporter PPP family 3-phenylpropionic acid transporter, partial [Halothiobacillaceae bacterium]
LVPYWGLYLQNLGFSAAEIGQLMAALMITKIISPNLWGWLADYTGRRLTMVRLGALLALCAFVGVTLGSSYGGLMVAMSLFGFFWHAILPQYEVITLNHLGLKSRRYTQIRLWGSIGFVAAVALLGPWLEFYGVATLPLVILLFIVAMCGASLLTRAETELPGLDKKTSIIGVLLRSDVVALFAVCFLAQASHGPYYTFYSIYLEGEGYSRTLIGLMWALGVIAEIGVFLVVHRLYGYVTLRNLLLVSLHLTTLRWLFIGLYPDNVVILLLAQALHAASFGLYHAVAIQFIHRYFVGAHQGRGQALYSSVSFGAGGAIGSLYSGYMWDQWGATTTFVVAALLSVSAAAVTWRWVQVSDQA